MNVTSEIFSGLVGQSAAKKWLLATLHAGHLPQALIFAGPKGVGRRTAAKALARYLHEQKGATLDSSTSLRMTKEGTHPDTFWYSQILEEIQEHGGDKESKSPWISTSHEMTKFLTMSPFISKYKVAIVDIGDKLTEDAQNALFKTFEEPRENSLIIFIVQNEEVLLPTIVSRAQVVRFGPLSADEIKQIVPKATDEQIVASSGSAGQAKDWEEMPIWWADHKEMMAFWKTAVTADIETKFAWSGKIKERDEAVEFIRTGMMVWREMLPDVRAAKGLERMEMAVHMVRDNVNLKAAIDTLLLSL